MPEFKSRNKRVGRRPKKSEFPVEKVRQFLEPGPIVLVSSEYKGERDLMTMGWHLVLEFSPSLIGCMITAANRSFKLIEKSGECVINVPSVDLIHQAVGIGNCSGRDFKKGDDKFKRFGLTPVDSKVVSPASVGECFANIECRLHDKKLLKDYNFFIFEVVHVEAIKRMPQTFHYRGEGRFMISGKERNLAKEFQPWML